MIDIKVFDLLVHFGENYSENLIELFEEGFLDVLREEKTIGDKNPAYVENVEFLKINNIGLFLSGYFHKASTLNWDYEKGRDKRAIPRRGSQAVMPRARFCIDLATHRLCWMTEGGITHSPSVGKFTYYLKKLAVKFLRDKYRQEAIQFANRMAPKADRSAKAKSRRMFYVQKNLTTKLFQIHAVPLISENILKDYFENERFVITSAKFVPHLPNATNDDFAGLFGDTARFGAEAGGKTSISLDATDKKIGLKKKPVKKVLDKNRKRGLVDFKMVVEDRQSSNEKPLIITNTPKKNDTSHETTDVSVKFQFNVSFTSNDIFSNIRDKLESFGFKCNDDNSIINRVLKVFEK